MGGPLEGLRVIDCSRGTAGTRATGILADLGADVIWVEPPGGDPFREVCAPAYSVFNRGKRSAALDLRDPAGRARLFELLASADVFIQSWRPGVAGRLGVGYDAVHARLPGLVYASISGFGAADGPERDLAGYEALVHARVGVMGEQVGHRTGPIYEALPFASIGAAYLALIGVLAALYRGREDGVGRHVETSLVDGALAYLSMMWGDRDDAESRPVLGVGAGRLVARTFRCADDEYLGVHTGAVGAFSRLMKALGVDDRIPPSPTGIDMGVPLTPDQVLIVSQEIPRIFASKPRAYFLERLLAADVCAIPELRACEVFDEPQARHNRMVVELDDPLLGRVEQVAPPARFPAFPEVALRPAPTVGQHTDEVFAELRTARARPADTPGSADARPLLEGVKILDLGAFYAGPYSSRLLADLGADVIKLEPISGDPLRGIERPFRSAQAGKRGLSVDLKDAALAPALAKLLAWADVVHHNMRPGAAERLGVGYEQVRAVNPSAVYLYAPGWGSTGPDARRQSFAPMMSGYAGVGYEVGGQFNPPLFPLGNEDPGNGLLGAVAALAALLHRQRTGEGQYVENPQLNATMAHMEHAVRRPDGTVLGAGLLDPLQRGVGPLDRLYATADGWLCVVALAARHREALGKLAGLDIPAAGLDDDALGERLEELFAARKTADLLRELAAAGVPATEPLPWNMTAFLRDPRNRTSGRTAELPHPRQGHVRELAVLVRVSDAAVPPHRLAPGLGEHTDAILGWLGYTTAQIAELRARKAAR